jgi:hypothetical protein
MGEIKDKNLRFLLVISGAGHVGKVSGDGLDL